MKKTTETAEEDRAPTEITEGQIDRENIKIREKNMTKKKYEKQKKMRRETCSDSEMRLLGGGRHSFPLSPPLSLSVALPPVSRHANRARMEPLVCLTGGDGEPDA